MPEYRIRKKIGKEGSYTEPAPEGYVPPKTAKQKKSPGGRPRTPVHIQQAVMADRAIGLGRDVIAEKYGLSARTVDRMWQAFKKAKVATDPELSDSKEVIFRKFRRKAVKAIDAGLDSNKDPYRRAGIGVKVMEGIGDFKSNEVVINNFNLVAQTPAQFHERYLGIEDQPSEGKET